MRTTNYLQKRALIDATRKIYIIYCPIFLEDQRLPLGGRGRGRRSSRSPSQAAVSPIARAGAVMDSSTGGGELSRVCGMQNCAAVCQRCTTCCAPRNACALRVLCLITPSATVSPAGSGVWTRCSAPSRTECTISHWFFKYAQRFGAHGFWASTVDTSGSGRRSSGKAWKRWPSSEDFSLCHMLHMLQRSCSIAGRRKAGISNSEFCRYGRDTTGIISMRWKSSA